MDALRSPLRPLFKHRLARAILWVLVTVLIGASVNVMGIYFAGDIDGWNNWLNEHSPQFLAWRICLYAATAYGWWWMRERIRRRESAAEARARLRRTEIAAVVVVLALEVSMLVQSP